MLADSQGAKKPPSAQETLFLTPGSLQMAHTRAISGDPLGKADDVTCLRNTWDACLIMHFALQSSRVRTAGAGARGVCFRKQPR